MITFRLSVHAIDHTDVVEVFDEGTLVAVIYAAQFGGIEAMRQWIESTPG